MADERPKDSTYWDDPKIVITAEPGRAQLQWQCYEHGFLIEERRRDPCLGRKPATLPVGRHRQVEIATGAFPGRTSRRRRQPECPAETRLLRV